MITVTVSDDGGTANGGHSSTIQSFTVIVTPLNLAPTINAVTRTLIENSPQQTIPSSGITDGNNGTEIVTSVTATSTNTNSIPNPVVTYTNPITTGTLTYTPVPGITGTATITLTVTERGGTANGGMNTTAETFVITVLPINHSPTLDRSQPWRRSSRMPRPDGQPDGHRRRQQHDGIHDRHRREQQPER